MKIIIMMLFLALSCTQVVYSEDSSSHAEHSHKHYNHKHYNHTHYNHKPSETHENNKPSLDHGAKWTMDSHTRKMFVSMSKRVHAGGDLKEMGGKLDEDLQKLIQGCTMTGAAHNQLHLFLAPYIPAVTELSQEGTEEALQKVKHALHDYQSFFE